MSLRQRFNRVAWAVLDRVNLLFDKVEGVEEYAWAVSPATGHSYAVDLEGKEVDFDKFRESWAQSIQEADQPLVVATPEHGLAELVSEKSEPATPDAVAIAKADPNLIGGYNKSWIRAALLHMFLEDKATMHDVIKFDSVREPTSVAHQAVYELDNGLADKFTAMLLDQKDPCTQIYSQLKSKQQHGDVSLTALRNAILGWNPTPAQLDELNAIYRRPRAQNKAAAQIRHGLYGWGTLDRNPKHLEAQLLRLHAASATVAEDNLKHALNMLDEMKRISDECLEAQLLKIKALQQEAESRRAAAEGLAPVPVGETDKPEEARHTVLDSDLSEE